MDKFLYRVDEVAVLLSYGKTKIYELLDSGELDRHNPKGTGKGLRITAESVKSFVNRHKSTNTPTK